MSFDGLRIALSSLQAQRRALEVTGQNVSNVATDGYSRQRVALAANAGPSVPAAFSRSTAAGAGVLATGVVRSRDAFIDVRSAQEHAVDAGLRELRSSFDRIELAFGEPSDNGLGAQLADFLAGWADVANRPDDMAARNQLVQRGETLAASFAHVDGTLTAIRATAIEELQASVRDVNAVAGTIAELNQRIDAAKAAGLSPNDLMDQRDLAANQLASSVGAVIRPAEDGVVDVYVGGTAIVRGSRSNDLQVFVANDPAQTVSVVWAKDQQPAPVGGAAGGLVATATTIVAGYRAALGSVATALHDEVNALHDDGFGLDGGTGRDFFELDAAGALIVAPALAADPSLIAASATLGATRDGSVARTIAATLTAEAGYRDLIVRLGVDAQTATRRVEIQAAITDQVDATRESISGVDIDEEMTDMIMYQHAYEAAGRLLTAVDELLDTLINRTGAVGR